MVNFLSRLERIHLDRTRIFLIILLLAILLYVDFSFILKTQLKSIGSIASKVVSLKKDITDLNRELEGLGEQKMPGPSLSKAKKIVPQNQKQELAQHIYDTANNYRVKVIQLKPWADPKAKEEVFGKLSLLPIFVTLDLSCGYHALGGFINALENGKYFVAVGDMRITRNPGDFFHHNITLVLKAYAKR
jgi:Tfp pilus assembly protein PilO